MPEDLSAFASRLSRVRGGGGGTGKVATMSVECVCFVVMPFRPELNFFFLYIQKHIEANFPLRVRRGDTSILTKALMEKIEDEIRAADLIIGDVTYSNPNVFYELGIARAYGKSIIFLTQDEPEKAPVDLRQFEFIRYDLGRHQELIEKLENAIRNAPSQGYGQLYGKAVQFLQQFNADTGSTYSPAEFEEFRARLMRRERLEGLPDATNIFALREFFLPMIIPDTTSLAVMRKMDSWITSHGPASPPLDTAAGVRQRVAIRQQDELAKPEQS